MAVVDTYKLLFAQVQLAASVATLATVGAGKGWIIKNITVVNNDTVARTFVLYRQGTAATNIITPPAISVPANGMAEFDGTMCLNDGETLRGNASVASMLSICVSGDEITY